MAYIKTVPPEEATGTLREIYDLDVEVNGYIPNHSQAMSLRPDAINAWRNLNTAIKSNMDLRRYELATIASALALRSTYCTLAHGTVLRLKFFSPEQLDAIVKDYHNAGLEPAEVAMMDFAGKITRTPYAVATEDIAILRSHGFSDTDILDIALTASARNFFSRLLDAIGAEPDEAYQKIEESLQDALNANKLFHQDKQEEVLTRP